MSRLRAGLTVVQRACELRKTRRAAGRKPAGFGQGAVQNPRAYARRLAGLFSLVTRLLPGNPGLRGSRLVSLERLARLAKSPERDRRGRSEAGASQLGKGTFSWF